MSFIWPRRMRRQCRRVAYDRPGSSVSSARRGACWSTRGRRRLPSSAHPRGPRARAGQAAARWPGGGCAASRIASHPGRTTGIPRTRHKAPTPERRFGRMAFLAWIDRTWGHSSREEGQTMAEYAVVLGVIVPAIILAYALSADRIAASIDRVVGFF